MSFIAKNPLCTSEINYTPSVPSGMRGLFAKEDGWYQVDSDGNVSKLGADGKDGKSPKIVNGNWWTWDDDLGDYVDTGVKAQGEDLNLDALNSLAYYGDINIKPSDSNLFQFEIEGDTAKITGVTSREISGEIVIPYEYVEDGKAYPITEIGDSAFGGCGLTSIVIPNGVTKIGREAFHFDSRLTSIVIPDSVTEIGDGAFSNCFSLTNVVLPLGITTISRELFVQCSSLASVVLPDSVTEIGDSAFGGCGLTSIVIPNGVTKIGNSAFGSCTSLTSVVIPDTVTEIERTAFTECSSLTKVTIPDGVTKLDFRLFAQCHALTEVTIPDSVTEIGGMAFSLCESLTDVYFKGTREQWDAIIIDKSLYGQEEFSDESLCGNNPLLNATIHYNWVSATKNYVDGAIGDIETALENIIAKYGLGGDAV